MPLVSLLYPRQRGEAPPLFRAVAGGKGVVVTGAWGADVATTSSVADSAHAGPQDSEGERHEGDGEGELRIESH